MLSNSDSCFNEALIIDCEWYTFPATSLPGLQDKPRRPQSEVVFARGLDEVWIGGLHQAALLWTCSVMLIYADDASLLELGSSACGKCCFLRCRFCFGTSFHAWQCFLHVSTWFSQPPARSKEDHVGPSLPWSGVVDSDGVWINLRSNLSHSRLQQQKTGSVKTFRGRVFSRGFAFVW